MGLIQVLGEKKGHRATEASPGLSIKLQLKPFTITLLLLSLLYIYIFYYFKEHSSLFIETTLEDQFRFV